MLSAAVLSRLQLLSVGKAVPRCNSLVTGIECSAAFDFGSAGAYVSRKTAAVADPAPAGFDTSNRGIT